MLYSEIIFNSIVRCFFKCKEEDVRRAFEKFGSIVEIDMPQKKGGFAGFCFVQFKAYKEAAQAMKEINGHEIKDRVVAVDWAIPKDQYMTAVIEERQQQKQKELKVKANKDDSSDEDGDTENEAGTSVENKAIEKKATKVPKDKPELTKPSDVNEGKTLFVRGLPFDVDDDELKNFFGKFGDLHYALICKFHDSSISKGSGFVKFVDKKSADACLAAQNNGESFMLKGRQLLVCPAVEKNDVAKIAADKNKDTEPKDKRNLHLLRVGLIRAGTQEANNMSAPDSAKRLRIEAANRKKIKDLNIFVSATRIVIHNLPLQLIDNKLKILCLKAVGDRNCVIKECRVMRDLDRTNNQGKGKSRGYAFVEFDQHEHALACLKALNNNPEIFTDVKRPIVEFSLENRLALNARAIRLEKSRLNRNKKDEKLNGGTFEPAKKKRKLIYKPLVVPAAANAPKRTFPSHMGPKIRTSKTRNFQKNQKKKENSKTDRKNSRENKKKVVG
uniref:RRM domain-containing protein n=1 Tax=Romanomermis culicivorax TaxID=13658 RepID=A0A915JQB0_ROMCU